jgi:hypothetical protein
MGRIEINMPEGRGKPCALLLSPVSTDAEAAARWRHSTNRWTQLWLVKNGESEVRVLGEPTAMRF